MGSVGENGRKNLRGETRQKGGEGYAFLFENVIKVKNGFREFNKRI